jgi:hypothetical protein
MTDGAGGCTPGAEDQVIQLLLEEYRALRGEVTQRVAERWQIAAIVGVVAAIMTAADGLSFRKPLPYAALLVAVVALGWWRQGNLAMRSLGDQLHTLESRINELAARAYGTSAVLTWEHNLAEVRTHRTRSWRWRYRGRGPRMPGSAVSVRQRSPATSPPVNDPPAS